MREKVLGLDLGTKTLGVAMSDALGIAHGKENFRFLEKAYRQAIAHVVELCSTYGIKTIALGYPLNMDGSAGESAKRSERFKEELEEAIPGIKVVLVDERLTTVMATRRLLEADISRAKRKEVIDQQAAVAILENYLAREENGI